MMRQKNAGRREVIRFFCCFVVLPKNWMALRPISVTCHLFFGRGCELLGSCFSGLAGS